MVSITEAVTNCEEFRSLHNSRHREPNGRVVGYISFEDVGERDLLLLAWYRALMPKIDIFITELAS